jgi:hypothetical protein
MINIKMLFVFIFGFLFVFGCDDEKNEGPCGNGIIEENEECDGADLNGSLCVTLGYYEGELTCNSECLFNISDCVSNGKCGDGVVNLDFEHCDDVNLNEKTCLNLGYPGGGDLICDDTCHFDMTSCQNEVCGDSTVDEGEECDRYNLAGITCLTYGYYAGNVVCSDECTIDQTDCEAYGYCGDGSKQSVHEECDGDDFLNTDCDELGYHEGILICNDDCTIDDAGCLAGGYCGDDSIQESFEDCDGTLLNSQSCETLGYVGGGTLACDSCQWDTTGCDGYCGDDILQYPGEECEPGQFHGFTCQDFGYTDGQLLCDSNCERNFQACSSD